ncbi:Hint domain-containing protein [Roseomonas sp. 18066]|uniref:Hint domain-containing protein n=1 Tax=Roseomonas sp. 18066 TaxID=2681412 RepID=UPI00135B320E|nr:Hint domain-containing protein [Roseomonas sp. 18066]
MALYDVYTTLNVLQLAQLGIPVATDRTVTDTGAQAGETGTILGDVNNDVFRANEGLANTNVSHTYLGTVEDQNGNVVGFAGSTVGSLLYNVYLPAGTPSQGLSVQLLPQSSINLSTQWNLTTAGPVCFLEGTLVATPDGEVAVETLRAGDMVLTTTGETRPVRWIGLQRMASVFTDKDKNYPIQIEAGALGENLPLRDLFVSPDHALMLDGCLVQAGALVNGVTIRQVAKPAPQFTYYHVELEDHALILAEGVAAETFVDNVTRSRFDNHADFVARFGEVAEPTGELTMPRVKSPRQLPRALRDMLAARIAMLRAA